MSGAKIHPESPLNQPQYDLPPCESRRDYWSSQGVFFCAHPNVHTQNNLVSTAICRACPHSHEPPPSDFRPYPAILALERTGTCLHLGEQVALRDCSTCSGHVQIKVFACSHPSHGETTFADCERCVDYERPLGKASNVVWAVGVLFSIANSESTNLVRATVTELGWPECRLFLESFELQPAAGGPTTVRDVPLGAFPHWYLALAELYLRA